MSMSGEPIFFVGGKRPRGRPRLEEPRSAVSTRIAPNSHDFLVRLADERSTSVSEVVRTIVETFVARRGISVLKK